MAALVWTGAAVEMILGDQLHTRTGLAGFASAGAILLSFIHFGPLGEELGWLWIYVTAFEPFPAVQQFSTSHRLVCLARASILDYAGRASGANHRFRCLCGPAIFCPSRSC